MKKHLVRPLCCLLLLSLAYLAIPGGAKGQQTANYPPYELYKFHMGPQGNTNGYYYTPWYSQGANVSGWTYEEAIGSGIRSTAAIYPNPGNGMKPIPSTGLVPLYQWTVFQGVRSYTYLSIYFSNHGSGYTYNGVAGYVYPPSTTIDTLGSGTTKIAQWYSATRGFWYGINEPGDQLWEFPPDSSYVFQGIAFRLTFATAATAPNRCLPFGFWVNCTGTRTLTYSS